jgi:hypothetical protein
LSFASEPDIAGVVKRDEVDSVERKGVTTSERDRLKALERKVKAPAVGFGFHVRLNVGGRLYVAFVINVFARPIVVRREKNRESVEPPTLEQVARFNRHRPMEPLGYCLACGSWGKHYYQQLRNDFDLNLSASTITGGGLTEILYFNLRM